MPVSSKHLSTWISLNEFLMTATQKQAEDLLSQELVGKRRKQFVFRIHSRINKVRADNERQELLKVIGARR